ncbi:hypothetical protein SIM91_00360 [Rhodococcus opacus]|uniref:hypothetical protein n=1 Tax=Rhodococcus opacus TaxID=37919 RepID=UPI0029C2B586|nr:hypothetical protein [Rhodococcus opacus]MDX5961821.1 hypothetical protein [Rhodococcus opacus]
MSTHLLRALQNAHAFDSTPPEAQLASLHVPFDFLTGSRAYEDTLARAVRRGERIALIGASGSGKTSITEHVLGGFVHDVAPIRVRVDMMTPSVSTHPPDFAKHVVHTVRKYIDDHHARPDRRKASKTDDTAHGIADKRPVKVTVGAGLPWLKGDLAVELGGVVHTRAVSGEDIVEQAQLILQIIAARGVTPVLVLPDTDHWIRRAGLDPEPLIAGFFGSTLRMIAERLSTAAVIAVHETYLPDPAYREASGFLESRITLPEIPSPDAIGAILRHRARATDDDTHRRTGDLVDPDALERLFAHYQASNRNLRKVIQTAHGALAHACDEPAAAIGRRHVELALTE